MSTWTHVTGSIRLDVHTHMNDDGTEKSKKKHKKALQELAEMIDWRLTDNNLPGHSEGQLGVKVSVVSEDTGLSQINISLFGDMRDFHQYDYPILEAYFKRAVDKHFYSRIYNDMHVFPRQGVLMIEGSDEDTVGNFTVKTFKMNERFN